MVRAIAEAKTENYFKQNKKQFRGQRWWRNIANV